MHFGQSGSEEERTRKLTEEVLGNPPGENGAEEETAPAADRTGTEKTSARGDDVVPRSLFMGLVDVVDDLEEQVADLEAQVNHLSGRLDGRRKNVRDLYDHLEELAEAEGYTVDFEHSDVAESIQTGEPVRTLNASDPTPIGPGADDGSVSTSISKKSSSSGESSSSEKVTRSHRPWEGDSVGEESPEEQGE